jgi:hypothetical protein
MTAAESQRVTRTEPSASVQRTTASEPSVIPNSAGVLGIVLGLIVVFAFAQAAG